MSNPRTKSAKVRHMLMTGTHTVAHISKVTKASPQLVYAMRAKIKKESTARDIRARMDLAMGIMAVSSKPEPKPTSTPTPPKTLWQRVVSFFKGDSNA